MFVEYFLKMAKMPKLFPEYALQKMNKLLFGMYSIFFISVQLPCTLDIAFTREQKK